MQLFAIEREIRENVASRKRKGKKGGQEKNRKRMEKKKWGEKEEDVERKEVNAEAEVAARIENNR